MDQLKQNPMFERDIIVDIDSSVAKRVYGGCCKPAWIQWSSPILLAKKAELHDTVKPERSEMQLERAADLDKRNDKQTGGIDN
jgi:hypothetical protein